MRVWLIAAAACLFAALAPAQQRDVEGSKDHPMFARVPGYYIEQYDAQDLFNVELATDPPKRVEGHYWKISYSVKEGAKKIGPVQIGRSYTDRMVKRGGATILDGIDAGGGTTVARMPMNGRSVWLQLSVSKAGEVYDVIVVEEAAKK
jgi:OOP family OmpA-OmpF porin